MLDSKKISDIQSKIVQSTDEMLKKEEILERLEKENICLLAENEELKEQIKFLKGEYSMCERAYKGALEDVEKLEEQIKQKDDLINKLQDDLFIKGGRFYERSN